MPLRKAAAAALLSLALVLMALLLAVAFWRERAAEAVLERLLPAAGLDRPQVEVEELTLGGAELSLSAGDGALSGVLTVDYDWRRLLRDRVAEKVVLRELEAQVRVGSDGRIAIAGLDLPTRGGGAGALPFDALRIENASAEIALPEGQARGTLSGRLAPSGEGAFRFSLRTDRAGAAGLSLEGAGADGRLTLAEDGSAALAAGMRGSGTFEGVRVEDADLALTALTPAWRPLLGGGSTTAPVEAALNLRSARIEAPENSLPAQLFGGDGPRPFNLSGEAAVTLAEGQAMIGPGSRLSARTPDGAEITVLAPEGRPLLRLEANAVSADARILADTPLAEGEALVAATRKNGSPWQLRGSARLDRANLFGSAFSDLEAEAAGRFGESGLAATLDLDGRLRTADLGGLTVTRADIEAPLVLRQSADAGLTVSVQEGECVTAPSAHLALPGGAVTASAEAVRLCAGDGPLFTAGAEPALALQAGAGRLAIEAGETEIPLMTPRLDVSLGGSGPERAVRIALRDGTAVLPAALEAQDLRGRIVLPLSQPEVTARIALERAVLRQRGEAPFLGTFVLQGNGRIAEDVLRFSLAASLPDGLPLGEGEGRHALASGEGRLRFGSRPLAFAPGALQPTRLLPPLSGIVSAAEGTVSANLTAQWSQEGLSSGAVLSLDDLSFRGPGVAVARTGGVSGTVTLSSLAPVATEGLQTLDIGLLDLRALQLEDGEATFALPGDGTVLLERAAFPWLGGTLGAYETQIDFAGGGEAVLRAEGVDIAQALAQIDVPGLSGEGEVEAVLPLTLDAFSVGIDQGRFSSTEAGVLRYKGQATDAVASRSEQTELAFDALEELHFERLSGTVDGPLSGALNFSFRIEGTSAVDLGGTRVKEPVVAPILYNINIEAPLLQLIDQARLSTDARRQIDRALEDRDR
ncbi:intermembrane phospholipid transport protein YdbH family protein [Parvularcula oceani]|uniref:intermembrane phospholipid transport protein YdbH family protein n=1 Tax=Parvularcula oceani TaxID=1247963 RepID=UPI000562E7CB|nr:YdbH domain-containing protein [Parvularcula oceani]